MYQQHQEFVHMLFENNQVLHENTVKSNNQSLNDAYPSSLTCAATFPEKVKHSKD
jgi:hypothetical protein